MMSKKRSAEKTVRDIRRATRRKYSAEEKIRIVIEGLRGGDSIAELCRREGINANVYYRWSKEFMEAGKKRLAGDVVREASSLPIRQTQGKIERWDWSMKNQILLNHYYLPSELQEHLQRFIRYYNHERYHESLDNLTPADVFYGRDQDILEQRQPIKHNTMSMRRKMVYGNRNNLTNLMS